MADSPIGGDVGTLAPPSITDTQAQISSIEADYEPKIQAQEKVAEGYETKAVSAEEELASQAEKAAGDLSAEDEEMQHWVDHTPSRQAFYATTMHAAPALSILIALGGKVTRLNGQQLLAAQTGMAQGLNEASEKKYADAYTAWQSAYQKMRDHQQRVADATKMMLTAYRGRADAYQKAADAARRMTGDLLDDKQRQISTKIDLFKANSAAWDKLKRIDLANRSLAERVKKDIAQENHWKTVEAKAAQLSAEAKAQIAAERSRWNNAKAQKDENLRRRGQISANLTMPADQKEALIQKIDDEDEALSMEMDKAQSNTDAIVAGATAAAAAGAGKAPAASPTAGPQAHPVSQPSPLPDGVSQAKATALKQHQGQPVSFGDGSTWIMDAQGKISRVQ